MLSVICPVLNEEKYINKILTFFTCSKPEEKELFIVDGGSTDNSIEIIKKYLSNKNIHLLHNSKKYVPFAMNMAIPLCKGEIIARIDAHSDYSIDYFEKILETFEKVEADIVGGPCLPAYKSNFQCATGLIIASKFGTGNSRMHDDKYIGYSDGVTFGAYKNEVFKDTGLFDERLKRNQDDEFFYRAKSFGKKIFLTPEIKLWYYSRSTLKSFFKQYFEYGIYKPIVLKKVKSEIKIRHLIPSLFTLYLVSAPLMIVSFLWTLPLFFYLILDLVFSLKVKVKLRVKLLIIFLYPVIHLAYGSGMIWGLLTIKKRK